MKVCTYCREEVETSATKCPYCHENPNDGASMIWGWLFMAFLGYVAFNVIFG